MEEKYSGTKDLVAFAILSFENLSETRFFLFVFF